MNLSRLCYYLLIGITSFYLLFISGCSIQGEEENKASKKQSSSIDPINIGGIYRYPLMNNPSTLDPAYVQN